MKTTLFKMFFLVLLLFVVLNSNQFAYAMTDKGNAIDDSNDYFTIEEKHAIESEIEKLPEVYRLIVLPTVHGSIENTGKAFFAHENFSQDTILILLLTDDRRIYVTTGEALQKRGLNDSFFEQEINHYFVSMVKKDSVSNAVIGLIKGISNDIPNYIVKKKNSPKLPDPPEKTVNSNNIVNNLDYSKVIVGILSVLFIVIVGVIFSKGIFKKK